MLRHLSADLITPQNRKFSSCLVIHHYSIISFEREVGLWCLSSRNIKPVAIFLLYPPHKAVFGHASHCNKLPFNVPFYHLRQWPRMQSITDKRPRFEGHQKKSVTKIRRRVENGPRGYRTVVHSKINNRPVYDVCILSIISVHSTHIIAFGQTSEMLLVLFFHGVAYMYTVGKSYLQLFIGRPESIHFVGRIINRLLIEHAALSFLFHDAMRNE